MKGLYKKYQVSKTDGSPMDPNSDYFVLRADKDPHARKVLRVYAESIKDENPILSKDIFEMLRTYEDFNQYAEIKVISLPSENEFENMVNAYLKEGWEISSTSCGFINSELYDYKDWYQAILIKGES